MAYLSTLKYLCAVEYLSTLEYLRAIGLAQHPLSGRKGLPHS